MASSTPRVVVRNDGSVRVHVSPEVLFNFEKSAAVMKTVLGRVGCPTCTSGFSISLLLEEGEFQV